MNQPGAKFVTMSCTPCYGFLTKMVFHHRISKSEQQLFLSHGDPLCGVSVPCCTEAGSCQLAGAENKTFRNSAS